MPIPRFRPLWIPISNDLVIYTAADDTSTFDPAWTFSDASEMTVDWGDGTPKESHATTLSHTYAGVGIKEVHFSCPDWSKVTGFEIDDDVCVFNAPSFKKLTAITSWVGVSNQFGGTLPSFAACTSLLAWVGLSNQFSGTLPSFAACTALTSWQGYSNLFSGTLPSFAACTALESWLGQSNQFSGVLPSFAACTALQSWRGYSNQFSGVLPSFAACTALTDWRGYSNLFSGTLPSFAACTALQSWRGQNNLFSGTLPSFGACINLESWYGNDNQFAGYTAGGFSTQPYLEIIQLDNNLLPVASIDAILADCVTSLGVPERATCELDLSGTGNAAPSDPAGLASKATLVAASWTVNTN